MDIYTLIEEIITKAQFGEIESQIAAEEILRVPQSELKRFAQDIHFDPDEVIGFKLDCKAIRHYVNNAITRAYQHIADGVCYKLLELRKDSLNEKCRISVNGKVLFEGSELAMLVQNGFEYESILQKISQRLGGDYAALPQ